MWDQSLKRTISDIFQNKSQCLENEDSDRIPIGACSCFRLSTTASISSTYVYPSISSTGAATSFPARRFPPVIYCWPVELRLAICRRTGFSISWVSTTAVVATEQSALSSSPLLAVAVIEEQSIIAGCCC
ncbi:hypothetical protein LXL04_035869 [Taraxacum kok-saghyz]